jgi:hypothetical protein
VRAARLEWGDAAAAIFDSGEDAQAQPVALHVEALGQLAEIPFSVFRG